MIATHSIPDAFSPAECDRILALADAAPLRDAGLVRGQQLCQMRFHSAGQRAHSQQEFERRLFVLHKVISNTIFSESPEATEDFYAVSMSSSTIVYKGMFLAYQLGAYYADLKDERFESRVAIFHQRYSTNTFPQMVAGSAVPRAGS
mgnify:CR=1 FL=1